MKVSVGVSNRHVHLTQEHLEILFGKGYRLENVKDLNQPNNFASSSFVTIRTEKSQIDNVRILGDVRNYTQVEISKTDAYQLGINPPVRDSGDLEGSSPITIVGPNGILELEQGCILANRHIHLSSKQKEYYGLTGLEKVSVLVDGEKGGILENVFLKVSDSAYFELHLDTDDANAHLIKNGDIVTILEENYDR